MSGSDHLEISGAYEFLEQGDSYLKVVLGASKRPQIFSRDIVFNLLGMAIEKHMMAILMAAGTLPDNHTFYDLVTEMKKVVPVEDGVRRALLRMDAHANMCTLESVVRTLPDDEEMAEYVRIAQHFQALGKARVAAPAAPISA